MRTLRAGLMLCAGLLAMPASAAPACGWPVWDGFRARFVGEGWRVIDPSGPRLVTTSEGQAYALFFALVAGDRLAFDRLLEWTEANLAGGDLTARLPAWQWGRRDDGTWGVLDDNAAADADLWLAYTLGEAGRLWDNARYTALGELLAARILREETADLPGLGPALLPGPRGFHPAADRWRLNPSYLPLQLLQRLATLYPATRWGTVARTSRQVIVDSAPHGFAPDWVAWQGAGMAPDEGRGTLGSYDAIRVYLWAGMLPRGEARRRLVTALAPMARHVAQHGTPPLEVETRDGSAQGVGPAGFSAALVPFLEASGLPRASREQRLRVGAQPAAQLADRYYDRALMAFAAGWSEGRFRFGPDGALVLRRACH